ncbi:MAG: porphobilinogen synthase [Alphaproteobacteria bacterium]|nr:MAG: porphobilinogen synthase [Alphaproteobacteria bacterium]TAE80195.1 MAG: porphobilinogen synthase [Alphaproteobacteria bacterium]TAF77476.1 MAG: porphobilinogen synthase [Alphaproteobacteria bacterium]
MRRNRKSAWSRNLVSENSLSVHDLVWPLFVQEGSEQCTPIAAMPGVNRWSIDLLVQQVREAANLGISAVALFPVVPAHVKTEGAEEAYNADNLICRAVRALKKESLEIGIICDVALDPYTIHGQDGLMDGDVIANDASVEVLMKQALCLAEAGADIVAPSDMMDGRIGSIRMALDEALFHEVQILSYAAKYASAFYGPFREAVGSAQNLGKANKFTYQMSPANGEEAIREVALDISEGADLVMVKPGMPYLDVVRHVSEHFSIPVFAYQVSGEYAMLRAAADQGWLDWKKTMMESLLGFKRAGATGVFTYAAKEVASWLMDHALHHTKLR